VVVGSDDIALDLATSGPHSSNPRRHFRSHGQARWAVLRCCGTGSHIAGTKLVDPETGEFSLSYRDQVLPGRDIAVVRLVVREQGLLVAPGNPLGVHAIADLAYGARYVDRRAGSVTRALFDRALRRRSHVDLRLRTAGTDAPGRRRLGCLGALRLRPRNPRCRSSVRARPRPVEERTVRSRCWDHHGICCPRTVSRLRCALSPARTPPRRAGGFSDGFQNVWARPWSLGPGASFPARVRGGYRGGRDVAGELAAVAGDIRIVLVGAILDDAEPGPFAIAVHDIWTPRPR
jgi:hypothetical protein